MGLRQQKEQWKDVSFGFKFTNDYRLQVSDMGSLRTFNKFSAGEILEGSTVNGYRIIRFKLYRPKDKTIAAGLMAKHQAVVTLRERIKKWPRGNQQRNKNEIVQSKARLKLMQDKLRTARQQGIQDRTINYHSLFHRLVAAYFVHPASSLHTVVSHMD